ncbi:acyltransferase domain-containing protein [Arthrobacter sp. STN4]|uniref:acyltransferase domain-containing protein n=1 Tax=Arthrobacter sp. STN4 TaxID=2923276 RepID=UPI002119DC1B|nr:acyltransferase domain-containing protein [Arthrobacter sp. STN4]MCQ9165309.1 acyltransferase domain-containing protein [Arthrobacter sp. STN4]
MIPHTALSTELSLDYLAVAEEDRDGCLQLLDGEISPAAAVVQDHLSASLGSPAAPVPELGTRDLPVTEADWLEGMLRFVPALRTWHAELDIPDAVTRDTLADFGRNLAINRRVHGRFGMDTWQWLTHHFAGRLFALGRLQFLIHQPAVPVPGTAGGEWVLGVHIPEDGGLGTGPVAESLAAARPFFDRHFPAQPVRHANCESWLLDPYLSEHIDTWSNIFRFAALFTPYGTPRDEPSDAVYFTFRTRSMDVLPTLPRTTALQRLVLDRIAGGGAWQVGYGCLQLP